MKVQLRNAKPASEIQLFRITSEWDMFLYSIVCDAFGQLDCGVYVNGLHFGNSRREVRQHFSLVGGVKRHGGRTGAMASA